MFEHQWELCVFLPFVLDVLVDADCQSYSDEGVVPTGDEHEGDAHGQAKQGQGPVGGDSRVKQSTQQDTRTE